MNFNAHSNLAGRHAFLSPSSYHWINYDIEHLDRRFMTALAAMRGTELHDLAHQLIRLGVKLPRTQETLNMYVNDAIGYRMSPEQALYYSENCFGTADAIGFSRNKLRVHDLKTGETPASVHQLEVYAAIFCLEYSVKPNDIEIELRLYQQNECVIFDADKIVIMNIMAQIVNLDKRVRLLKEEALS